MKRTGRVTGQHERDRSPLARGFSTAQISATLYISKYTVQEHLCSAFDKVGVRDRQALVKRLFFDNIYPTLYG